MKLKHAVSRLALALMSYFTAPGIVYSAIVSVSGPDADNNGPATIIEAPADAGTDTENDAQQGYDELQGVTLSEDLVVDGGTIAAGTTVDSHMIFYNTGNVEVTRGHLDVVWDFSGAVLGVMSDIDGELEAASNELLGAEGTLYPGAFANRGQETEEGDNYGIEGQQLTVGMSVMVPGDWIRVITAAEGDDDGGGDVPEVVIDVRPYAKKNRIKLHPKTKVLVAIHTTSVAAGDPLDFDATQVDASTLRFGPAEAPAAYWHARVKDVDGDGDADLVVMFKLDETGITCEDTAVTLSGETFSGESIWAKDEIEVGCKNENKHKKKHKRKPRKNYAH